MTADTLRGQVGVITGASNGIGAAVARELHARDMQLVLTGRSEDRLRSVGDELDAPVIPGDLADPELPRQLLEMAVSTFGRCDLCFNGAGSIEVGPIESIDIDKVCHMARINVEASYRVAYIFMRHFRERDSGHLINVSSVLGTKVRETAGAYAGTKYAIEALSEALRMEVAGSGVAVTCVEPGLVNSGLHRDWTVHPSEGMNIAEPLQPADIARCVAFMLTQPPHVRIPRLMVLPSEHKI